MANGEVGRHGEPAALNVEVVLNREPESVTALLQTLEEVHALGLPLKIKIVWSHHAHLVTVSNV